MARSGVQDEEAFAKEAHLNTHPIVPEALESCERDIKKSSSHSPFSRFSLPPYNAVICASSIPSSMPPRSPILRFSRDLEISQRFSYSVRIIGIFAGIFEATFFLNNYDFFVCLRTFGGRGVSTGSVWTELTFTVRGRGINAN